MNSVMKKKRVVCSICGKEFQSQHANVKYCSLVCKEAARRKNQKHWRSDNPNYNRDYMRQYRRKKTHDEIS